MTEASPQDRLPPSAQPLPWQAGHWQRLWEAHAHGRLGHALLLTGPAGVGKRHFADRLSAALLCAAADGEGRPCGTCAECRLLAAGTHPDLLRLEPEPESTSNEIKVDAVRLLAERQALTAQRGPRAIVQIVPAEAMNPFAANALLKTLEEPAGSTLLLLLSESPARLPATVRSRCQEVRFGTPPRERSEAWLRERLAPSSGTDTQLDARLLLRLAQDAPLRALAIADPAWLQARMDAYRGFLAVAHGRTDPVALAAAWQQHEPGLVLGWLAGWIADLIRCAAGAEGADLSNPDLERELRPLAASLKQHALHLYLQQIFNAKQVTSASVNKPLLFEALLVRWARLTLGAKTDGQ